MDSGGFLDFLKCRLQGRDIGLGGIENNGDGLGSEVTAQVFNTAFKGDVPLHFVDTALAMQVYIEHYSLSLTASEDEHRHQCKEHDAAYFVQPSEGGKEGKR